MQQKNIKTYIAIGLALIIFVPFVFGGQLFSRIFPFGLLRSGFFGGGPATDAVTPDPLLEEGVGSSGTFDSFSDPVTILDLEVGGGAVAEASTTVSIGYVGIRIDPKTGEEIVFDQNLSRETPFSFVLGSGQVIPGFDQGVTGMRVGGKRLVIIQPEMGYGNQQVGSIPPNTTLQFMIELYEVKQ
ncbi:MAG: FKBP-type peptidyl-prolyl cis-trans isomerase [Candidatus Kaiserbacteria bacterium]|nr:FKBP-type peptidyl-prolyl cis-trans isomerase [Candidatus Kaiserbacteria bacterium]